MAKRLSKKARERLTWKSDDVIILKKRFTGSKSPVRKSIETLRDELQKLFPEQKVVIR